MDQPLGRVGFLMSLGRWELCFEKPAAFAAISSLSSAALRDKLKLINLLLNRERLCYKLIRELVKCHKHLCPL